MWVILEEDATPLVQVVAAGVSVTISSVVVGKESHTPVVAANVSTLVLLLLGLQV